MRRKFVPRHQTLSRGNYRQKCFQDPCKVARKILLRVLEAMGIERLNTKAFQLVIYAFPGRARKLMLLTNVANIDIPTTQAGILPLPDVNCDDVLFLKKKLAPKSNVADSENNKYDKIEDRKFHLIRLSKSKKNL